MPCFGCHPCLLGGGHRVRAVSFCRITEQAFPSKTAVQRFTLMWPRSHQLVRQTVYPPQVLERYIAGLDISDTQPWLLQHFIRGPEYASYSIVDGGSVVAHADNVAELSCLNYAHVGNHEVCPPCVDRSVATCCTACDQTHRHGAAVVHHMHVLAHVRTGTLHAVRQQPSLHLLDRHTSFALNLTMHQQALSGHLR